MSQFFEAMFRLPLEASQGGLALLKNASGKLPGGEMMIKPVELGASLIDAMSQAFLRTMPGCPGTQGQDAKPSGPSAPPAPSAGPPLPKPSPLDSPLLVGSDAWGQLDPTTFVVVGSDFAAGMGEYGLSQSSQKASFAAQIARQMGSNLKLSLFQAPGIGAPYQTLGAQVRPPDLYQTFVRTQGSGELPSNLAVPGLRLNEALKLKPKAPLIHADNPKQTALNLIFGFHALPEEGGEGGSALDAAVALEPSFTLIELGFCDALAVMNQPDLATEDRVRDFARDYAELLRRLKHSGGEVLATTVPNPLDTAFFNRLDASAHILKLEPGFLERLYGLVPDDRINIHGLMEIGNQILARSFHPLEPKHILRAADGERVERFVAALNRVIAEECTKAAARLFDLSALLAKFKREGVRVGTRVFKGDYLGGIYGIDGTQPGMLGHALIASELVGYLNQNYASKFPEVELKAIADFDSVANYAPASGPVWTWSSLNPQLQERSPEKLPESASLPYYPIPYYNEPLKKPLTLPANREQVLPLTEALSYHGDGMRVVDCANPMEAFFGGCGNALFGGLALFGSHLRGSLRFRFEEPVNHVTRFQVDLVDGVLHGQDGVLSTGFYRFPLQNARVVQPPGVVCGGVLDLSNGAVSELKFFLMYQNTGLNALIQVNPHNFPTPAVIPFQDVSDQTSYGTSWGRFSQRADGQLDFTYHGTSFIPLRIGAVFPLPFASASGHYPLIPSSGTALHPHLHLSTVEASGERSYKLPEIPTNTTLEFELCTSRSSFGDKFRLNNPLLGEALGRSYLTGRLKIQFGERFGDSVPFSSSYLPPAGTLEDPNYQPLQSVFPSKLTRGLNAHDGLLKFPLRSYNLSHVYLLEDPFDLALGAVDLRSGLVLGDFMHRGFIGQDLIFALLRVEPRTPKSSFAFRGPAAFQRDGNGQLRYVLNAALPIPYPEGFQFPIPDLASGVTILGNSALDPFLQLNAIHTGPAPLMRKSGGAERVESSTGQYFSYTYSVTNEPGGPCSFTYCNHDLDASFQMFRLSAISFYNAASAPKGKQWDSVQFSGLGRWSTKHNEVQTATVTVSSDPKMPYVSILIGGGEISNVNTVPASPIAPLEPGP